MESLESRWLLAGDIVAWWPGDGNHYDVVGGNDGTLQGGVTFESGLVGSAFRLDGVDDYLVVADDPALEFPANAMTIEAWVKVDDAQAFMPIITKESATPFDAVTVGGFQGDWDFAGSDDGAVFDTEIFGGPVVEGQWQHVAFTQAGGVARVYVDGAQTGIDTSAADIPDTPLEWLIGGRYDTLSIPGLQSEYFGGLIDELTIYNRELTVIEINAIYQAGAAGKDKANAAPTADAGGPYIVDAGSPIQLDGSASSDPDNAITTYQWDFDYDGVTFNADASGVTPTFDASIYSSAVLRTIALQVTDAGGLSDIVTTQVSISGIVSQWGFNDGSATTATDSIGGNDGTLTGGVTYVAGAAAAMASDFDGINDFVQIPDDDSLDLVDAATLDLWIDPLNFSLVTNSAPRVIAKGFDGINNSDSPYQLLLIDQGGSSSDGVVRLVLGDGSSAQFITGTTIISSGAFTHVTATWDGTDVRLYVNGVLDVSVPQTVTPNANTRPLYLGAEVDPVYTQGVAFYEGRIDELAIFNRALSSAEILQRHIDLNQPPTADAGGPYTASEGGAVTLDASASSDPNNNITTYEWDFEYDGVTFVADDSGVNPSFSAVGLDGPSSRNIAVRVTDAGGLFDIATTTITIDNVSPTIALSGAAVVSEGATYTLNLGAVSDPGDDTVTSYVVNWGDGTSDTYGAPGDVTHVYADGIVAPGANNVTVVAAPYEDTLITDFSANGWGPNTSHPQATDLWSINYFTPGAQGSLATRPMFQFDLSAYAGQTANGDATFRAYLAGPHNSSYYQAASRRVDLYRVTQAWDDDTVTWNNRPGIDFIQSQSVQYQGNDRYIEWTIPQATLQGWLDDPGSHHGVMIVNELPDAFFYDLVFASKEHASGNVPQLEFQVEGATTIRVDLVDEDGTHVDAGSLDVAVENAAPTATVAGPYTVESGASITLDGSLSSDPGNDIISFDWDDDYDGVTFEIDASGMTPLFDTAAFTSFANRTVRDRDRNGDWCQRL